MPHKKRNNDNKNTNRSTRSTQYGPIVGDHFNATLGYFYALRRPKEMPNIAGKTDMIVFRQS